MPYHHQRREHATRSHDRFSGNAQRKRRTIRQADEPETEAERERSAAADYAQAFRENVFGGLKASDVAIIPGCGQGDETDILRATEIGLTLLMGKPLLVLVEKGQTIPPGLRRAAAAVVDDWDQTDPLKTAEVKAAIDALPETEP